MIIREYAVIEKTDALELAVEVDNLLKDGWMLHGHLIVNDVTRGERESISTYFYQAMIR